VSRPAFKFIDLFAGIGGFHAALAGMGGHCVYASEIDPKAAAVYRKNWKLDPLSDITVDANEDVMNVPAHDVLTAGFPCQPFSKSGAQLGMDETRGTLYWNILKIIQAHHPKIVLLENVRNLAGPRHRHEWQVIIETLRAEGYRVSETPAIFSPHLLPPDLGPKCAKESS
jgi:DNA (cytosine-5)-methyltransferase 1